MAEATDRTVAAVDIGTNSVKMTVGRRRADGGVTVLWDTTQITRLGKGVDKTGVLDDEAVHRTLAALASFAEEALRHGATRIAAVGTSALRDARNGAAFIQQASQDLGGTVEVISGDREAELIYLAARRDPDLPLPRGDQADVSVAATDGGGGSTEVVLGKGGAVQFQTSLQMGAVRLTEQALPSDPPKAGEIDRANQLADETLAAVPVPTPPIVVVASGGTAANLAAMVVAEQSGSIQRLTPDELHGTKLTLEQIEERIALLAQIPLAKRRETPGLEPDRADVIIAGAIIQARSLRRLGASELFVSVRGLRYGLLYELLGE